MTNEEYEALAIAAEDNPPKLSGKPGFFLQLREKALINALSSNMTVSDENDDKESE